MGELVVLLGTERVEDRIVIDAQVSSKEVDQGILLLHVGDATVASGARACQVMVNRLSSQDVGRRQNCAAC